MARCSSSRHRQLRPASCSRSPASPSRPEASSAAQAARSASAVVPASSCCSPSTASPQAASAWVICSRKKWVVAHRRGHAGGRGRAMLERGRHCGRAERTGAGRRQLRRVATHHGLLFKAQWPRLSRQAELAAPPAFGCVCGGEGGGGGGGGDVSIVQGSTGERCSMHTRRATHACVRAGRHARQYLWGCPTRAARWRLARALRLRCRRAGAASTPDRLAVRLLLEA